MALLNRITLAVFVVSLVAMAFFVISMAYETPPVQDQQRALLTEHVKRGSQLVVKNAYTQSSRCSSWFYRSIFDSANTRIFGDSEYRPMVTDPTMSIQTIRANRTIPIPLSAALGTARYEVVVEWACNPVQRLWPIVQYLPIFEFQIE